MSQSVKLKDGSYIDASGVWVSSQSKTVENALKWNLINLQSYVQAGGVAQSWGTLQAIKQEKLVVLKLVLQAPTTGTEANTTWLTLPEGYRPMSTLGLTVFPFIGTSQRIYIQLRSTGELITKDAVEANAWVGISEVYLTL